LWTRLLSRLEWSRDKNAGGIGTATNRHTGGCSGASDGRPPFAKPTIKEDDSMSVLDDPRLEDCVLELRDHVQRRNGGLGWCHRLGVLLARVAAHADYGQGWQKAVCKRFGLGRDLVYKSVKFAGLFTAAEAAEWDGRISWSKLVTVLSVRNKRRRDELCRAAVRGQSCRALSAAVGRQTVSRRPRGGRRPAPPVSKGTNRDVAAFLRLFERVEKFLDSIVNPPLDGLLGALRAGAAVPSRVRRDLRMVVAVLDRLGRRLPADMRRLLAVIDAWDAVDTGSTRPALGG
jgi:hypothetical protein